MPGQMDNLRLGWVVTLALIASGCAGVSASQRRAWETAAAPAVTALQAARFDDATQLAKGAVAQDPNNSRANAVLAVSLYQRALHDLITDVVTVGGALVASGALQGGFFSTDMLIFAFKRADDRLAEVDGRLAAAALDPEVSLELCLACWEVDWNRNGQIDERDRRLFEVELDSMGAPLPPEDPRRRPTFRFDVADVHWLRALISFQRAAIALVEAWDWKALAPAFTRRGRRELEDVTRARDLILAGVAESRACRQATLAETDDDREWLPNPRQKSHAIPLPVDDALYETWRQVLDDVDKLVRDQEALSVSELAQLGKHQWEDPPKGYLHLGKWLSEPREIVLPLKGLNQLERGQRIEQSLGLIFGGAFSQVGPASQLPARLTRMKGEVELGAESFEKKLRYLLWVN